MNPLIIVALFCVSAISSFEIAEDDFQNQYYLVPVHLLQRHRRQTTWNIEKGNPGTRVTLGHKGTILNDGKNQLTAGGFASKQFKPSGPLTIGGNLDYNHIPSGSSIGIRGSHTQGFGTDLGVGANANVWRKGNSRLDLNGEYGRHFGGPFGTGKPNYNVGATFSHRF